MCELYENREERLHAMRQLQTFQAEVIPSSPSLSSYIVVVRTKYSCICKKVVALTPLEAICQGEKFAKELSGVMEDISYLDP